MIFRLSITSEECSALFYVYEDDDDDVAHSRTMRFLHQGGLNGRSGSPAYRVPKCWSLV